MNKILEFVSKSELEMKPEGLSLPLFVIPFLSVFGFLVLAKCG